MKISFKCLHDLDNDKEFIIDSLKSCGLTDKEISFHKRIFYIGYTGNERVGFFALNCTDTQIALEYFFIRKSFRGKKLYIKFIIRCAEHFQESRYSTLIIDVKKNMESKYLKNMVETVIDRIPYASDKDSVYYIVLKMDIPIVLKRIMKWEKELQ